MKYSMLSFYGNSYLPVQYIIIVLVRYVFMKTPMRVLVGKVYILNTVDSCCCKMHGQCIYADLSFSLEKVLCTVERECR